MKVKLIGINYETVEGNPEIEKYYFNLLNQVPFPIEVEAEDQYPFVVCLKKYIKNPDWPDSSEEWGLNWFIYEEIKENKN